MGNRQPGGGRPASCRPSGERRVRSVCERYRGQRACDKGATVPSSREGSSGCWHPRQSPRATRNSNWLQESSSPKTQGSLLFIPQSGITNERWLLFPTPSSPTPSPCLPTHQTRPPQLDPIQATQQCDGDAGRVKELLRHGLYLGRVHCADAGDDLINSNELVEVHLLARQVGHARIGALHPQQDVALDLILGAGQLFHAQQLLLQLAELLQYQLHHVQTLIYRGACKDAQGSGVAAGAHVGVDGVGHAPLLANGLEEA